MVSNMAFIVHFIYGMSSFPLTNSIIFQDGYCTTNQNITITPIHYSYIYHKPKNSATYKATERYPGGQYRRYEIVYSYDIAIILSAR